eukprot:892939-Pleurochrysis_carterae.AAC.4
MGTLQLGEGQKTARKNLRNNNVPKDKASELNSGPSPHPDHRNLPIPAVKALLKISTPKSSELV